MTREQPRHWPWPMVINHDLRGGIKKNKLFFFFRKTPKNLGPPNCWKGAGGSQDFGVFLKKKTVFFIDASPYLLSHIEPSGTQHNMQKTFYLSEMLNIFVQIAKWICLGRLTTLLPYLLSHTQPSGTQHNMQKASYLSEMQNIFVKIAKWICLDCSVWVKDADLKRRMAGSFYVLLPH